MQLLVSPGAVMYLSAEAQDTVLATHAAGSDEPGGDVVPGEHAAQLEEL